MDIRSVLTLFALFLVTVGLYHRFISGDMQAAFRWGAPGIVVSLLSMSYG